MENALRTAPENTRQELKCWVKAQQRPQQVWQPLHINGSSGCPVLRSGSYIFYSVIGQSLEVRYLQEKTLRDGHASFLLWLAVPGEGPQE